MLRYMTAGESHGKQLTVILEGIPAGLKLEAADINADLVRRQAGFGRGSRMNIEKDRVEFLAGVRLGETIGSPICLAIKNLDWDNWKSVMSADPLPLDAKQVQTRPRPGHADLAGVLKFNRRDIRDILERASARETAARVAAGAVCKKFLREFGVQVYSFTREIGGIAASLPALSLAKMIALIERSELRAPDAAAEKEMKKIIVRAKEKGDTVGGIFTVVAQGIPAGLGSHAQWDLRLDGNIARGLMAVQAVKGVEFGLGFRYSSTPGSSAHDEIFYSKGRGFYRHTNSAGGIEGGITNGEDIVVSGVMKPIPSLTRPLRSVNIKTKKAELAAAVRSDVCAVPAAGVVGEAAVAFELARAFREKLGGDSVEETRNNFAAYVRQVKKF